MGGVQGMGGGCCCGGAGPEVVIRVLVRGCDADTLMPGVRVSVTAEDGTPVGSGTTDVFGTFEISGLGLQRGIYLIDAEPPTGFNISDGHVGILIEPGSTSVIWMHACPSTIPIRAATWNDDSNQWTYEDTQVQLPEGRCVAVEGGGSWTRRFGLTAWNEPEYVWEWEIIDGIISPVRVLFGYRVEGQARITSCLPSPDGFYVGYLHYFGDQVADLRLLWLRVGCGPLTLTGFDVSIDSTLNPPPLRLTSYGFVPFLLLHGYPYTVDVHGYGWTSGTGEVPAGAADFDLVIEVQNVQFAADAIVLDAAGRVVSGGYGVPARPANAVATARDPAGVIVSTAAAGATQTVPKPDVYEIAVTAPGFVPNGVSGAFVGGCIVCRFEVPMRRRRYGLVVRFVSPCTYLADGSLRTCPGPSYDHAVEIVDLPDGVPLVLTVRMSAPIRLDFDVPDGWPESWSFSVSSEPPAASRMLPVAVERTIYLTDLTGADPVVDWPIQLGLDPDYRCCFGCCSRPLPSTLILWDDLGGGEMGPTTLSYQVQGGAWVASYSLAGPGVLSSAPAPCVLVTGVDSPRADVHVALHCDGDGKGRVVYDVEYSWDCEGGTTGTDTAQGVAILEDVCVEVGSGIIRTVSWPCYGSGCESLDWLPGVASVDLPE